MQREEVDWALDLAAAEGWNPGLHDAGAFYAADPHGFLLGELDGEPVGCISAVAYDEGYGFIGLYIVRPEFRGRGYGFALWQAAMAYLGERNVGLDGVVAQQENYRRSGFRLANRNVRYARADSPLKGEDRTVSVADVPRAALAEFDRRHFPAPRAAFLDAWLAMPNSNTRAVLDGDTLRGYGTIRSCRSGYKIGPLFADDAEIAEALFRSLSAGAEGEVYLDVPEPNVAAVHLAHRHGFTPVFETARMYTGPTPSVDLDRVFGVTTFELG
jgi:ribosomal protein S18 acetylase RimI-like enzyme